MVLRIDHHVFLLWPCFEFWCVPRTLHGNVDDAHVVDGHEDEYETKSQDDEAGDVDSHPYHSFSSRTLFKPQMLNPQNPEPRIQNPKPLSLNPRPETPQPQARISPYPKP